MNSASRDLLLAGLVSGIPAGAWADEPRVRHGTISEKKPGVEVLAGSTMTLQTSNDDRLQDEGLLSVDLTAEVDIGKGKLLTYVEGNISPRTGGISSMVGEVNDDAGSALDARDKGRFQVSEIHYTQRIGGNILTMGMLDPDCRLDNSAVANDETHQFLAGAFVNNPTIPFPDYTLGGCMHIHDGMAPYGFNVLVTSSHGLADNPNRSYSELFDVGADGKGIFAGIELYRQTAYGTWRVGVWQSTADNAYVDGSAKVDDNAGMYLSGDYVRDNYGLNLRLGVADEEVSEAARFASLAFEGRFGDDALGIATGYTGVSDEAGSSVADLSQSEVYYRFAVGDAMTVTPSLQWVNNSGSDDTGTNVDDNLLVYSLRLSMLFE